MMMKKFYFLTLFAAAVFSACSSDSDEQSQQPTQQPGDGSTTEKLELFPGGRSLVKADPVRVVEFRKKALGCGWQETERREVLADGTLLPVQKGLVGYVAKVFEVEDDKLVFYYDLGLLGVSPGKRFLTQWYQYDDEYSRLTWDAHFGKGIQPSQMQVLAISDTEMTTYEFAGVRDKGDKLDSIYVRRVYKKLGNEQLQQFREQYTEPYIAQMSKEDDECGVALVIAAQDKVAYVQLVYTPQSFGNQVPQDTSLPYFLSFNASELPGMVYESGKYITFKLVEHHAAEGNHTADAIYLAGTVAPSM